MSAQSFARCASLFRDCFKIETLTKYIISCCLTLAISIVSLFGQDTAKREFLFKTKFDTTRYLLGTHIELKVILPKAEPGEFIKLGLDDRDEIFRSGYSRLEHIQILREYLAFEGDTAKSNRRFHFKPAYYSTLPEDTVGYTIQVEALYSFTRLLTIGFPPIRPTIVNRKTGEHLNTNLGAIREVYEIYRNWFAQNAKNDFKSISLPLEGTSYAWLGEDKMNTYHFRQDLFDYLYKK
ncbi:MAG: hypothetical protein ABL929_06510 [Ferruginibacter sp.]